MATQIAANLEEVRARIAASCRRSGRDPREVSLVCVTKTVGEAEIREAVSAGALLLGENRVQDAARKRELLGDLNASWHLIGHLQTNKAKVAVSLFDCIHSVDSAHVAEAINKAAGAAGRRMPVYVQVNVSGEETKYGIDSAQALELACYCRGLEQLELAGFMTMAPYVEDAEETRPVFCNLRLLRDEFNSRFPEEPVAGLSMGMTNDFEVAVEEGATVVRIGSAVFGEI